MFILKWVKLFVAKIESEIIEQSWGGSRGGSGGSVEPPKLNVKTYNKRVVKKK